MIGCIVLAAGSSTRMGSGNKLVADVDGRPLVTHVVDAALEAGAHPVVVVVSEEDDQVAALVEDRPVRVARNPRAAEGISTSLATGIVAVQEERPPVTGTLVCLGDMPLVRAGTLRKLMDALPPRHGVQPVVPVYEGRRGNPVLWPVTRFQSMLELEGDVGAKPLIDRITPIELEVDDPGVLIDVDDELGLERVRRDGG